MNENGTLALMPIFCDGMVLQRDVEYEIWGRESAAESVVVELDGAAVTAAVIEGKFRARLPAHPAGAGLELRVRGSVVLNVSDVCFGDVFLFSGQSNFELPCSRVLDASAEEIAGADYPLIREYKITPSYRFDRPEEEVQPAVWRRACGSRVYGMSAAAFFFARELHRARGVPIGIVLNAVGGSRLEAWLPNSEIERLPGRAETIAPYLVKGTLERALAEQDREAAAWLGAVSVGFDRSKIPIRAKPFTVPGLTANTELEGFSGSVWFYKEVCLEKAPRGEGLLYLGELIDSDETYINGVKVGETGYRYPQRKYKIPAGLLRAGGNLVAVRLIILSGAGGFVPEHPYYLLAGGLKTELGGLWKYAIEAAGERAPARAHPPRLPAGLYNSSIAPLAGLRFKGVLWYQGESDAYEPENYLNYAQRLALMVKRWRETLRQDFGFICVELADYEDPLDGVPPGWEAVQRALREAPGRIPRCLTVSAKDLGEPFELHPQRKEELGLRLAGAAESLFYE